MNYYYNRRDLNLDTMELMKYLNRNKTEKGAHEEKNKKMRWSDSRDLTANYQIFADYFAWQS